MNVILFKKEKRLTRTCFFIVSASLVANDGTHTGRIVIKSKNSQFKVTIPYHAQVVTGDVAVADDTITRFHLSHR